MALIRPGRLSRDKRFFFGEFFLLDLFLRSRMPPFAVQHDDLVGGQSQVLGEVPAPLNHRSEPRRGKISF